MSDKLVLRCLRAVFSGILLLLCSGIILPGHSRAVELKGDISFEGFYFPENSAFSMQTEQAVSFAGNVEFFQDITDNMSFTLEGFYRLDSEDSERSHGDLRLAELLYFTDLWEVSAGFGHVFWGATEFVHLVDIINQTDMVEYIDGEEKLGQPMVHLTIPRGWGVVEAFVMPWFRERTFHGLKGRFRPPLAVDTGKTQYESSRKEHHTDVALRYSTTVTDADIGLYHFTGTSREPVLKLSLQQNHLPVFIPYYEQIGQTGLDIQMSAGEWLLKGEALYRTGQGRDFFATTFGFEYTFSSLGSSLMDLGLIGEYVFDDRNQGWLPTLFDKDIMAGLRLAVNDLDDTTLLAGVMYDLENGSTLVTLEAGRRVGEDFRVNLEAGLFCDIAEHDPAYILAEDDYLRLEVVWYW